MPATEITETWSPKLNELIKFLVDDGATESELLLMGVLSIMDETLRSFAQCPSHEESVYSTYMELEEYIKLEGVGH